jgi:hypothetical protein
MGAGSWTSGELSISGLAAGSYTVNIYARLYVVEGSDDQYYDTALSSQMITICGCE